MPRTSLLAILALIAVASAPALAADAPVSFRNDVAPILIKNCLGCHSNQKAEGGLNMATFALLKAGGKAAGETILEPGDPDASYLIEVLRPGAPLRMPYKLPPLERAEVRTLERWVREGAKFDGPSETETPIASLVDPLKGLPRVPLKVPAADAVTALAFTPDGTTLAAAQGRSVVLYDAKSGKPRATLDGHPGPLTAVRITPDGTTLIACGGRSGMFGAVTVWALPTRSRKLDLRGHDDAILAADLAPDGKTLATASYDKTVLLWDLSAGKPIRTLKEHTDAVYGVAFAPDGATLASVSGDRTVKVWETATGKRLVSLPDATGELYAVAFGPDGKTVLAGGTDRSIRVWEVSGTRAALRQSVFAHAGAVLRLIVAPDGKTVFSGGEDRAVKVWDRDGLKPRASWSGQSDWPQALALSPDGTRLAVGRFDGSLALLDAAKGTSVLALREGTPAPSVAARPAKPELFRPATLGPPSPRSGRRGTNVRVTLGGNGAGRAVAVVFPEPGINARIIKAEKPDPNRLDLELTIAPDARPGIHSFRIQTPIGTPGPQTFVVAADPEAGEAEPNDRIGQAKTFPVPAILTGVIGAPGDVDRFRVEARAGRHLVFALMAKPLGSSLTARLRVLDERGHVLAETPPGDGSRDPVLGYAPDRDRPLILEVSDVDQGGSGNHFYRIDAGPTPWVTSVFPLGVERGQTANLDVEGWNLEGVTSVPLSVPAETAPGMVLPVPVRLPDGSTPRQQRTVVVAEGPQAVEAEPNDGWAKAERLAAPGGISGRIDREGDADLYRFEAKAGERWIVEAVARRLGSPIDPVIEVLDANGKPVPRAVLRPVAETAVAFRDHGSALPGIRLTQWTELAMDDYLLAGKEVMRIFALPRNPDDDCQFWSAGGQRLGAFETTPEHHSLNQPMYKVEVHPPGTTFPPGGVPPVTLTYRNDDGGPGFGQDARVTFDVPRDGAYGVRVEDARGLGGADFAYHLVVRRPHPDFRLSLSTENPNVPRGGGAVLTASIERIDGFDAPVDVAVEGLPEGMTATPARIERGATTADLLVTADATARVVSPPTWKVIATSGAVRHEVDPGGPRAGWVTVVPKADLKVTAKPDRVVIAPGGRAELTLTVERGAAFKGRVPIDVRNLPHGVRVLDIGLNGVLVTEAQTARVVRLAAEPWVEPMERPFYAVGKVEAAGTDGSPATVGLVVRPDPPAPPPAAGAK